MAEALVEREENEVRKKIFSDFIVVFFLLSFLSILSMLTNAAGNAMPTANKLHNDRSHRMASIDVNKGMWFQNDQFNPELPIRSRVTNSILSYQFDLELSIRSGVTNSISTRVVNLNCEFNIELPIQCSITLVTKVLIWIEWANSFLTCISYNSKNLSLNKFVSRHTFSNYVFKRGTYGLPYVSLSKFS